MLSYIFAASVLLSPVTGFAVEFAGTFDGMSITDAEGANIPPVASFTYTVDGDTVTFEASNSIDPDGSIVEYKWDFGDGAPKLGANVSFEYSAIINKAVTLTITDNLTGISITRQSIIDATTCSSTPFHETSSPVTNTYQANSNEYYAFSGGYWSGPEQSLSSIEFFISSITGDISSKDFAVKIYSTDTNHNLAALKAVSKVISGSTLSPGWTPSIQFTSAITITTGDAIVFTEINNQLDGVNFIILAEDSTISGNFDEGIWGTDFNSRRLWSRSVLAKLYK